MAHKISQGSITGSSRRRAGLRIVQSNETAMYGPSECKTFCKNIVHLNQRRLTRSRLSSPSISALEYAKATIISRNWNLLPIGASALSSFIHVLNREYRRLQPGFYVPLRCRGPVSSLYFSHGYPLIRFSPHYVLKDCLLFLDIGAEVGIASVFAARIPAVRISAIELDPLTRAFFLPILLWF